MPTLWIAILSLIEKGIYFKKFATVMLSFLHNSYLLKRFPESIRRYFYH